MQYLSQRLASTPAKAGGGARPSGTLAASQRERILDGAEQLIGQHGCSGTSIEAIVKAAGVSSVTFYDHFEDKEACFVAAFDRAVVETGARMREAADRVEAATGSGGEGDDPAWPGRVRAALSALLEAAAAEPARARLCLVEAQTAGPAMRARCEATLDAVAAELRHGRLLETAPRGLPDTVEEAAVGGIAWLVRQRVELGRSDGIDELLPKLTEIALSPYLDGSKTGFAAAAAGAGNGAATRAVGDG
jgi:AcrR family transcriptional regulator